MTPYQQNVYLRGPRHVTVKTLAEAQAIIERLNAVS